VSPPAVPPTPARPRRRWLLWSWLLLLAASHLTRLFRPEPHRPAPDELTQVVGAVRDTAMGETPVRIAYRKFGPPGAVGDSAPVILLVHGSPGDNNEVTGIAAVLGQRYRTLAPDLPGFGGSTWDVPDYSNRAHARCLLALLDSLGIDEVHAVGFSMGGGVVLQMEALQPGRVRSLTMLAAIGAQEYELLGDYHLNHAIHLLQLAGLTALRDLVPHFGWLDDAMLSVPYARNFFDTDQRPLRRILERYQGPMLILHGERDILVPVAAAREHARIVPQAELRLSDGDHFDAFLAPETVAAPIGEFVEKVERGDATTRATADPARLARAAEPFDPKTMPRAEGFALVLVCVLLALATLLSEDLTCIAAGLMVANGTLPFLPATVACFVGIFVGDILVFLAGRGLGRAVLHRAPLRWFLTPEAVALSVRWIERQGAKLVFTTRLLPGTRLPTYFAAGMLGTGFGRFALYFFLACLAWTPFLVGISAAFGEVVQAVLQGLARHTGLYLLVTAAFLFLLLQVVVPLLSHRGRRLLLGRWRRLTRWEFWPRWAFYPPVVLYILWLALKHRSLLLFTAVNPGIPGGGFVGESKGEILRDLAPAGDRVARWELIPAALPPEERVARALAFRAKHVPEWPLVLKPDIGERGSGVAVVRSEAELEAYLAKAGGDTMVQAYAPGQEFGVFYVRHPGEARGRIFSVTEKRFPVVLGDGVRDIEHLILEDKRGVCMAPFYLRRHAHHLDEVLPAGQPLQLVELGTHCRGAVFLDGRWVVTPALEAAIDEVSRCFPGFHFGRYDIRTPEVAAFQAGENYKIVELNGATAEATHIYDPRNGLLSAYRTLFEQWRLLFEIARANVERGARPATFRELWALLRRHRGALRTHAN
jgi:pimeloyl-ACP methyl ester carboxylesterase/membrane protein DedA with SNARE-associated domain